jgi:hypothetical protein
MNIKRSAALVTAADRGLGHASVQALLGKPNAQKAMSRKSRLLTLAFAIAALPGGGAFAAEDTCSVSLTQDPLVMRLGKDEFRIAFGLDASNCNGAGCSGSIRYETTWETEDGVRNVEQKTVSFDIPAGAERSLSVDRSYFDTAEAKHTTNVVSVDVSQIRCDGAPQAGLASR